MLLQFAVGNFRSFHGEQLLSLVPAKSRIHPKHVMKPAGLPKNVRGLPLAVLYGPNASGKSNLIKAIECAQEQIVHGLKAGASTGTVPFRLHRGATSEPSRFEFVFTHESVRYTYGFLMNSREIREEWLFAVIKRREVRFFERLTEKGVARVEFGDILTPTKKDRQRLEFVAAGTRPNQLFLTESHDKNVQLLEPPMHWFRDHLIVVWPDAHYSPLVPRAHEDREFTEYLANFLKIADTGIAGLDLVAEELDFDRLAGKVSQKLKKSLLDKLDHSPDRPAVFSGGKIFFALRRTADGTPQFLSLKTKHLSDDGGEVLFEAEDESDGTHRIMHLAPALLNVQASEDVFVIDELDRSLHPHLARLFVEAFLSGVSDRGYRGQMILTTHDTNLLDLDLLRRDEIWFVEKDQHAASHLTSLAEFKRVRADLRIDKGYLAGRFGAIPFLGDPKRLIPRRKGK